MLKVEWWLPGAGGKGEWEVLEMDGGDSWTKVLIYIMPLNCYLKMVELVNLVYFTTIKSND